MKLSVRLFSIFFINLLCIGVSNNVFSAQTEKPERWFEIEVILFNQLGNKDTLKEYFPENINESNLPQHKKYYDLFSAYLQPDLTGIKQSMPLCVEQNKQDTILSLSNTSLVIPNVLSVVGFVDSFHLNEFSTENLANTQKELSKPLFSTQNFCTVTRKDMNNLFNKEQLSEFELNGFSVNALPSKFNALGIHNDNAPYLIADDSLLLGDIKKRLQWSKEFKAFLHFGWRQVGVTRKKAIPLKLFAGKHLNYQYNQALEKYQLALAESKLITSLSAQQLKSDAEFSQEDNTDSNDSLIREQIFEDINTLDETNINQLISVLESETFEELIATDKNHKSEKQQIKMVPPEKPAQPWFLDGFLKVHLDHYLYITADFNVLGESSKKDTSDSINSTQAKLINFSQNKRAITGEIHYFDHPYIGMIVQIRRFDPSKPKDEAVTQVIN